MIRISKSAFIPASLQKDAAAALLELEQKRTQDGGTYKLGSKDFNEGIWKKPDVVAQAKNDQSGKCCYCESTDFDQNSDPQVEHWYPKTSVRNRRQAKVEYPGYYWKAYDWDNLFWSCQKCNRPKNDYLPIRDGVTRVLDKSLSPNIMADILFVHPSLDDPEDHITFEQHLAKAKNGSQKGENTIIYCQLDRLNERRRKYLEEFKSHTIPFAKLAQTGLSDEQIQAFEKELNLTDVEVNEILQLAIVNYNTAAFAHRPYTGMIRANFPHLPHR